MSPGTNRSGIRQALATDPRVGEPELSVDVVAGRVLRDRIPCRASSVRDAIDRVVAEVAAGAALDNRVTVPPKEEPSGEEAIA